jgi:uncharacterized protein YbgA (DUF1722 family)
MPLKIGQDTTDLLIEIAEKNNLGRMSIEDRTNLMLHLVKIDGWLHDALSQSKKTIEGLLVESYEKNDLTILATTAYQILSDYAGGYMHEAYLDVCDELLRKKLDPNAFDELAADEMRQRANDMQQEIAK